MDNLTRILLTKYDPSNELLRASVGVDKSEALPGAGQAATVSPVVFQKAVEMTKGRTGLMTVIMNSNDYSDMLISKACGDYNKANPDKMSHSFQLPATFEGIPIGSWVHFAYEDL